MSAFKDTNGKDWTVKLTGPLIREIREQCGILYPGKESEGYELMAADPALLVDVLWILCKKQAAAAQITPEQFGEALVDDSIGKATEAMLEALINFSQGKSRELLRGITDTQQQWRAEGVAKALDKISDPALKAKVMTALDAEIDDLITEALTPRGSATGSPVSSGSPPTTTPSAS